MIKHFYTLLLLVAIHSVSSPPPDSFALDHLGCLTCHRYPGLVQYEKPDRVKVLHIDEEKHLTSPHKTVDCRDCHTRITSVPHTGETGVECTVRCHLEEKDKIVAMQASLSAFHREERFAITRMDDPSSCRVCHPLYPHSDNHKVRAFLNMHTGYLVCEGCHLKKDVLRNIFYDWKKPDAFEFTGEPYGTHSKKDVVVEGHKAENVVSRILRIFSLKGGQEGGKPESQYLLSRIAVFTVEKGEKRIQMNTADSDRARKYKKREKDMGPEMRETELQYFHRDIAKKEISVACNECHSPAGILDFGKLGFDEKRVKDLEYMNIKSLVTKYDVFYLPHLY